VTTRGRLSAPNEITNFPSKTVEAPLTRAGKDRRAEVARTRAKQSRCPIRMIAKPVGSYALNRRIRSLFLGDRGSLRLANETAGAPYKRSD
jgi:hypothetical protein